jgi:hypothetical protein
MYPTLSNGGVVDYGIINLGMLSATQVNQLGQKDIDLTINCTAPTKVSWNLVDERSSSNANLVVENATSWNFLHVSIRLTALVRLAR